MEGTGGDGRGREGTGGDGRGREGAGGDGRGREGTGGEQGRGRGGGESPRKSGSMIIVQTSMSPKSILLTQITKTPRRSKGTKAFRKTCTHDVSAAMETRMRIVGLAIVSLGSSACQIEVATKVVVMSRIQLSCGCARVW